MNTKLVRLTCLAAALIIGSITTLSAAEASKENAALSAKMLKALETANFEDFIADGDASWKKLQKGGFDSMSANMAPKMKAGYEATYLGELKAAGGVQVTLWKLVFKSGDDLLVTLKVKEGKVAAFGLPRL